MRSDTLAEKGAEETGSRPNDTAEPTIDLGTKLREMLFTRDKAFRDEVQRRLEELGLGQKLKDWREAHNVRQSELARLAGIHQSQISKIESGKFDAVELRTLMRVFTGIGATFEVRMPTATSPKTPSKQRRSRSTT